MVVVGALVWFATRSPGGEVRSGQAPPFTLASTSGGQVSLSDYQGHNVLLYFNEGVGCDACFYQTVELENNASDLQAKDITLLPIVVNPADQVQPYLDQFGITTPYLIDADGSVSRAYGVMGKGMHADLPGHGFVFIDASGQERWSKEYPSMYASTSELLGAIGPYLD
jgi:peroxiredoxin